MQWILDESVSAWDICWEKRNTVHVPLDLNMEMKPKHSWTWLKQKERNQVLVTLFELLYQSMSQLAFGFLTARANLYFPAPPPLFFANARRTLTGWVPCSSGLAQWEQRKGHFGRKSLRSCFQNLNPFGQKQWKWAVLPLEACRSMPFRRSCTK